MLVGSVGAVAWRLRISVYAITLRRRMDSDTTRAARVDTYPTMATTMPITLRTSTGFWKRKEYDHYSAVKYAAAQSDITLKVVKPSTRMSTVLRWPSTW